MTNRYLQLSPDEINALLTDPSTAEELAYPEVELPPQVELDIDKSWHLIHFLLNGTAWEGTGPLGQAILGGIELEGTDAGYGPFRLLTPAEVSAISEALLTVSGEELWKRFDAQKAQAAEIYPQDWSGAEHERGYVLDRYSALQRYFQRASAHGKGVLTYLA
jgi:hypothetical protein